MDFIERLFHVDPDHGTGLLELAILAIAAVIPAVVIFLRKSAHRRALSRSFTTQ
jgi:hypothetical protein